MYIFRTDWLVVLESTSWCAFPSGGPLPHSQLSQLPGFFVQGWGLLCFSCGVWHVHRCHPCPAHIWGAMLVRPYGVASAMTRRHGLTAKVLVLWLLLSSCPSVFSTRSGREYFMAVCSGRGIQVNFNLGGSGPCFWSKLKNKIKYVILIFSVD